MSFSAEVKNEILSTEGMDECCLHAFAYGIMLFSRAFSYYDMYLMTEHSGVAEKYCELMEKVCGVKPNFIKSDAGKYKIEIPDKDGSSEGSSDQINDLIKRVIGVEMVK